MCIINSFRNAPNDVTPPSPREAERAENPEADGVEEFFHRKSGRTVRARPGATFERGVSGWD